MIGIALAAIVFIAMYVSEKAGFRRDLSKFTSVEGNRKLAVLSVFYALIGAGFYEEFTFRGFLMQGLAMMFGGHGLFDASRFVLFYFQGPPTG